MSTVPDTLRRGDIVHVRGVVSKFNHRDSVQVEFMDSRTSAQLVTTEIVDVERYSINNSDRIKWHEDGRWNYGTVLAINEDIVSKKVWLWVCEDGKWPRRTLDLANVQRAD